MHVREIKLNWRALLLLLAFGLVVYFIYRGVRDRSIPFLSPPTYQSKVVYTDTPIKLTYWRTADDPTVLDGILADFKQLHPTVTVDVKNIDYSNYDQQLAAATKNNTLPDIYMARNDWLPRYKAYVQPAPATVFTADEYRNTFADVISHDLTTGDTINGVSFGVSTLGIFYNQDMFAKVGLSDPPKNWQEFAEDAQKLSIKNGASVLQAGASLGTPAVAQSTDILSLLMMQNGAQMTDTPPTKATFASPDNSGYYPSAAAVNYYISFSNPNKSAYTWTDGLGGTFDAFASGKLAMMINYPFVAPQLDAKNPALNYKVAAIPQLPGMDAVNYASHWDELVSKSSKHGEVAWDLLRFISSREELNKYSIASYRPASRRDLSDKQKDDRVLGPFAGQIGTARTWYEGNNYNVDGIFADLINSARGGLDAVVTTRAAETRVTQEIVRATSP